jgi:putative transposase
MQIREVLTAARSPWQNPFAERLIGSIRRECLDHVVVLSERHLRHVLTGYVAYYHRTRTHLSLTKDAPAGRPVEPPELGSIVPIREVGGLHRRRWPASSIHPASGVAALARQSRRTTASAITPT